MPTLFLQQFKYACGKAKNMTKTTSALKKG